jgi:hypothetical protein
MSDKYDGRSMTPKESIESKIKSFKHKGYNDNQILNFYKQFPKIFSIAEEILNKKEPKSKPISVKKMAKETKQLSNKIENENEEWNKGRKEIKYLNTKPKKERLLNLTVYIVTDKTGRHMEINTDILSDQFTTSMKNQIIKDFSTKAQEVIKQRKREGRIVRGGNINLDSESDGDS